MHTLDEWKSYFVQRGITSEDTLSSYLKYIENLNNKKLPVIFDFEHLSLLLGLNKGYVASVISSPTHFWRSFKIRKRSGGFREICAPYPALLYIQRWIYSNILIKIKVSPYCHGFRIGRSIVSNAKWHVNKKEILKIDLSDFFPSITINRVIAVFKELGYNHQVSFYLASLCCLDGKLPQGAPTSPCLSNLILRPLDYRIVKFAKKIGLNYTRYADDLTFSGDEIRVSYINTISRIIEDEGFLVNKDKTRLYKRTGKRIVTGICVTDRLSIPRDYKRKIKQEIYYIKKYGLLDHLSRIKSKKRHYCATLLGKICYWLQVEPKNTEALEAKNYLLALMRNGYSDI